MTNKWILAVNEQHVSTPVICLTTKDNELHWYTMVSNGNIESTINRNIKLNNTGTKIPIPTMIDNANM